MTALADRFFEELQHIDQSKNVDVLICAPPDEVYLLRYEPTGRELGKWDEDYDESDPGTYPYKVDFHDLLKAQSLLLSCPTQLVWSPTYTGEKMDLPGDRTYPLQDEATRAWNFYVALYYKAGGTPWRLVRHPSAHETCFVGVSFYQSLDWEKAHGSAAQIFNERGEGLIMQGGPAKRSRDDRQLHLSQSDARELLAGTLRTYRREHGHAPARLVLHKTSPFSDGEKEGFWEAADAERIEYMDLIYLRSKTSTRFFRMGYHPPLRGTFVGLDRTHNFLYTVGSINFYRMNMAHYVPNPLEFDLVDAMSSPLDAAREILALTKMNWNNTQISQMRPVTIEAARHVGALLKYADREGIPAAALAPKYSYYM